MSLADKLREQIAWYKFHAVEKGSGRIFERFSAKADAFEEALAMVEVYEVDLAKTRPLKNTGVGREGDKVVLVLESATVRLPIDSAQKLADLVNAAIGEITSGAPEVLQ